MSEILAKLYAHWATRSEVAKRSPNQTKRIFLDPHYIKMRLYLEQGGVCALCGKHIALNAFPGDDFAMSIDHVLPKSKGGKDCIENYQLAHRLCNSLKGNSLVYLVENDDMPG